jgi:hypothetical protein
MPKAILTKYGNKTVLTASLASLASDTSLLAGIESSIIDNTTDGFSDIIVSGVVTTGTSPNTARQIEVWAIGWDGANWPDVFDGTSSAETVTSAEIKASICKPVAIMQINNTSNRAYPFEGVSLRGAFGQCLPSRVVLFVTHNTGVALKLNRRKS